MQFIMVLLDMRIACYEVQGCGLRVTISPVKFAPLVFSKEFNPDETIKKVSLGKRAKVAGYGLRVTSYELRVAGYELRGELKSEKRK